MTIRKVVALLVLSIMMVISSLPSAQQAGSTQLDFDGTLRRIRIPVLMYHYISEPESGADDIRINLSLSPNLFEAQLRYLQSNDYQTITFSDLYNSMTIGTSMPARPIILTFDDGYLDHYTEAFPRLTAFGYTGVFFVITEFADNPRPAHLTWEMIQEMADGGMDIQPHTKTHRELRARSYDFLVYEIMGSAESIEANVGQSPNVLSYPVGRYDNETIAMLYTSPLKFAVTTQPGVYHTWFNRFELPRLRVSHNMGVPGLVQLLNQYP